jgi:hypothetical protein
LLFDISLGMCHVFNNKIKAACIDRSMQRLGHAAPFRDYVQSTCSRATHLVEWPDGTWVICQEEFYFAIFL